MRIEPVAVAEAPEDAADLFERARGAYGWLPETIRMMARGSGIGELYLDAGELNAKGTLSDVERELVAVLTAAHNRCEYCLTAHSLQAVVLGASKEEVVAAREGGFDEPILRYAKAVLDARGRIDDDQLEAAREAGLDDTKLLDVVGVIAENTLGNLVNNVAETELDEVLIRASRRLFPEMAGSSADRP